MDVSDNGAQFTSLKFKNFLNANLIRQVTSAPFHPSTNGQTERMVRTMKEALSRIINGNWERRLADLLLQQCITPYTATGRSPAELLMDRQLSTMLDWPHPDRTLDISSRQTTPVPIPRTFQPEDLVFTRNYSQGLPWTAAVISRATGPVSLRGRVTGWPSTSPPCGSGVGVVRLPRHRKVADRQLESEPAEPPATNGQSCENSETKEGVEQQPEHIQHPNDTPEHQPALIEGVCEPAMASSEPSSTIKQPYLCRSQRVRKVPQNLKDYVLALADCQ